ncbi:MAG: NusA N-terminal domain-containing protein, partial [Candidatus Parcubacteria bacterium]|nr:NusA N-terminal domain-containing protein [Candidatus Parcubacteria bacterium]
MEDIKNFASAIAQIAEEKGIPYEKVIEIIEQAYAAAYKKDYGEKGQIIKTKMDPKTGHVDFWQQKTVVDETMIFSEEELEKMKEENPL